MNSWIDSLTERLVVAMVSGVASALTLALYPLALIILGHGTGGGVEFELGAHFYSFVFWKVGLFVIISASVVGFCVGAERMTNVFSFFWGTHEFWKKLGAYLDDKRNDFQEEHNAPLWLLIILISALAFVALRLYA